MSTRLVSLALVALLAGLVASADVAAQTHPDATGARGRPAQQDARGKHNQHAGKRKAIARKLGLTEAQREQMRSAAKTHKSAMEQARQAVRAAADTLRAALAAQPRDAATVAAAHVAMDQARDASKAARASRRAEVGAALTPEQRAQLEAAKQARQARKDGRK